MSDPTTQDHLFVRPGQVRAGLPAPDKCMVCGEPEAGHGARPGEGGWISGPYPPPRMVPPGSTPLRELLSAIDRALTLPGPATTRDELTYLRISRDRARLVMLTARWLLANREADDTDVLVAVAQLRDQAAQLGDDAYDHHPLSS
jgi:hypothetical protein